MQENEISSRVLTIPNFITLLRIILSPFALWLLWNERWQELLYIAGILFITDFADGFLARKLGQVSYLGIILDPTADKIILIPTYFILTKKGFVPLWAGALFLAKDLSVPIFALIAKLRKDKIGPTLQGKLAVVGQMIVAILLVLEKAAGIETFWETLLYPVTGL